MGVLKEFREFTARGNVIDLAVGVIIGAAFGKIVTSLVDDMIMPPIGMALGRVDFSDLFVTLDGSQHASLEVAKAAAAPVIAYGRFLNTIVQFTIVAAAVFMLVRQLNRLKAPPPAPVSTTRQCPFCFSEAARRASRCPHCTAVIEPVER